MDKWAPVSFLRGTEALKSLAFEIQYISLNSQVDHQK